ncbi:MAG: aminotransferase class V-fold PLP-dependent enzyme [Anaerolineales bacterium]|nr:aminotransferase class V-fold PLP-dependent enzyme [Anaerolineales bacterium]
MDPRTLKAEFLLDPDIIFLNHGSFGACPRPVFEEYQRWQRELERQPVEFLGRRFNGLMRAAREALAGYVGTAADNLVYVPNATTALNIVARSLKLQPGDEVLITDHEYGAIVRLWRFVCAQTGARLVIQSIPVPLTSADEFVEALWAGVTPRTRVLCLSHITSPTALIFPVEAVCRRAREAGLLTVVDGAHTAGQLPLALDSLGADVYTGNCHKWLCAPKGSAFLYVRPEFQPLIEPLIVSWGYEAEAPGPSRFIDEQEYTGTRDIAAYLATPAAIRFQAERNWPQVRERCHALLRRARAQLIDLTRQAPLCADSSEWFGQMAAVALPEVDVAELKERLYADYRIEVPVYRWGDRCLLRVSVQGYNSSEDLGALVGALEQLLPR